MTCETNMNQTNNKGDTKMKTVIKSIAALLLLSASAFAADLVNVSGASKIAVSGYDPVAFSLIPNR